MNDMEKIVKGLECCITDGTDCPNDCPYLGECNRLQLHTDALGMLESMKSFESIESNLHLCDSCAKIYPECDATKDGVVFGSGTGNDNIIGCTAYVNRWMPQNEPRVMTLDELSEKTDVYFESLVYDTVVPALSSGSYDDGTVGLMTLEEESFYVDEADYGVKWRCWTDKLSNKRRKAAKWNDPE